MTSKILSAGWITATLLISAIPHPWQNAPQGTIQVRDPQGTDRYVAGDRLPLKLSPSAPAHAELFRGAAVHVAEAKDGWSRVTVWGWVPSDQLLADRPEPKGTEPIGPSGPATAQDRSTEPRKRDLSAIPDVDASGRKVTDLKQAAVGIAVATLTEFRDQDNSAIAVGLGFLAPPRPGVLVSFEQTAVDVELALYEKRIIAGAQTHGNKLFTGRVTIGNWQDGLITSQKIRIPLKDVDLKSARTDQAILVARATLPNGYVVWGRDYDVILRRAEHAGEAKPTEGPKKDG